MTRQEKTKLFKAYTLPTKNESDKNPDLWTEGIDIIRELLGYEPIDLGDSEPVSIVDLPKGSYPMKVREKGREEK